MKNVKKLWKNVILVACVFITLFSTQPIQQRVIADTKAGQINRINHARNSSVSAYKAPIAYWSPEKMVDGIINRDDPKKDQSRWSSESGAPGWVLFDLHVTQTFDEVALFWETKTVQDYHIEISEDGNAYTTIYTSPSEQNGHPIDDSITLDAPVNARYVKLIVDTLIDGAYPSLSLYEVEIIENKQLDNLALDASITSSDFEAESVKAENAIDGNRATWWGSNTNTSTKWLALDFHSQKELNSIVLDWERRNVTKYDIQTSTDGINWETFLSYDKIPDDFIQIINFDTTITTQYIRVLIHSYNKTADKEDGTSVTWNTVGITEFEAYKETLSIPEKPELTPKAVADNLVVTSPDKNDTTFQMPEVPEGFSVSFVGADYEQILAHDLSITRPLTTQTLIVNFEVRDKKTKDVATSKEYEVVIEGTYDESASINKKPKVIPELQEWYGTSGEFRVSSKSRIIVEDEIFKDAAQEFQKDYKDISGNTLSIASDIPKKGDFVFIKKTALDEEAYEMNIDDHLNIYASSNTGAYWATRSILQILKQTESTISKGLVKDYPKYKVRGFMLDVGRKALSMDFLEDVSKTMSWYKLNDFQIHLNDNYIWDPSVYIGFRLESDIPNLSNTDLVYSKEEFRDLINDSKRIGVNIVPEFDTPGHSAAFTRARPDIARGDEIEYLDVENPDSLAFVKDVIDEYVDGSNPVFPKGTTLHVGTDEYKRGNKEAFRKYQDDLLTYVRDEKGITPRVWGSQSENAGTTPITSEGVQMNLWNIGYSHPKTMYELGYDLINTNDGDLYIVPSAGYYYDYLNQNRIATSWQPNVIGNYTIPVGSKQMSGAAFTLWNDMIGPKDKGDSDIELFDRIYAITPTFGAKLWGDIKDYSPQEVNTIAKTTKYAPNSNPTHIIKSKTSTIVDYSFNKTTGNDFSGNEYNLTKQENISYVDGYANKALQLHGGESYVETPLQNLGVNATIDFWINKDASDSTDEQILFESEIGSIKAVQKESGKFGFSRDFRDHSFNYTLPDNEWTHITLRSYFEKTELFVNGEKIDELSSTATGSIHASLLTPLQRIGSKTNAFKGKIDDLVIFNELVSRDKDKIPHSNMEAFAISAQPGAEAAKAIDDNTNSIWHTKWDLSDPLPQDITLTFDKMYTIDKLNYLPRQVGTNGTITKYAISISKDGVNFTDVASGTWNLNAELKTVNFAPIEAKYIRLRAIEAGGGFATAAEIDVYKQSETLHTQALMQLIKQAEILDFDEYTQASTYELEVALQAAKQSLNFAIMQNEIDTAQSNLQSALDNLEKINQLDKTGLEKAIIEAEKFDENKYTTDSFQALQTAVQAGKDVLENATTQSEIDTAIININEAVDALVEKSDNVDKSQLDLLVKEANAIDTSLYTKESADTFIKALNYAEIALETATTQSEIDNAFKELNKAINALIPIDDTLTYQTLINTDGTMKVSGYFPKDTILTGSKIVATEKYKNMLANNQATKNDKLEDVYDISLYHNQTIYEPTGRVEVSIQTDFNLYGKQLSIVYFGSENTIETRSSSVDGTWINFTTDHFSIYGITSNTIFNPSIENPDTGDYNNIGLYILTLLLPLGVFAHKRKKHTVKK
ncbi:MAG: discoidin domain-containing protein [Breznakia sp.]